MLYDKSLEKDNCGFGLIAHIEGEPSHKVVRTAIRAGPDAAPWRDPCRR